MSLAGDIKQWNDKRKQDLINSYIAKGFRASGNWSEMLEPKQTVGIDNIKVDMLGASYTYYMMNGRASGKMPPVDKIQNWINNKKLDLNAYAVAKTIQEKGTLQFRNPDTNKKKLLSDVYTPEKNKELLDIIGSSILVELRNEMINILK